MDAAMARTDARFEKFLTEADDDANVDEPRRQMRRLGERQTRAIRQLHIFPGGPYVMDQR